MLLPLQSNAMHPIKNLNREMVVRFQMWLRAQNYLASTIAAYSKVCFGFCQFLRSTAICDVKPLDISDFISSDLPKNWTDNCLNFRLAALRSLFDFLYMGGVIDSVPPRFIHPRKQVRKLPDIMESRVVVRLLNRTHALRDRAFLELLYASGCRLKEALALRVPDVDLIKRSARVKGKRKERIVYFGKPAARALRKYLKGRHDGFLFQVEYRKQKGHLDKTTKTWVGVYSIYPKGKRIVQRKYMGMVHSTSRRAANTRFKRHLMGVNLSRPIPDRPLCQHTAWKILRNAARRIGKDFLPARVLRHSYATHLCENGADIRTIQELLGHSCLSSTQIYLQVANRKMERTYRKTHPRQ